VDADRPFLVLLSTLEEGETHREMVGGPKDLDLDPKRLLLEGPVILRGTFYRRGPRIEVQGTLTGRTTASCDKCLEPVEIRVDTPFRIFAERRESRDHRPVEEVREDDVGIVYHDGRFLDLTEEVRQEFLVQIPWHVRCKDDCLGLCPRCGVDRNRVACDCFTR